MPREPVLPIIRSDPSFRSIGPLEPTANPLRGVPTGNAAPIG